MTSEDRRLSVGQAELALLAFTDLAALLIASMMLGEQQTELAAQLQSALNSRAIIEQARACSSASKDSLPMTPTPS